MGLCWWLLWGHALLVHWSAIRRVLGPGTVVVAVDIFPYHFGSYIAYRNPSFYLMTFGQKLTADHAPARHRARRRWETQSKAGRSFIHKPNYRSALLYYDHILHMYTIYIYLFIYLRVSKQGPTIVSQFQRVRNWGYFPESYSWFLVIEALHSTV